MHLRTLNLNLPARRRRLLRGPRTAAPAVALVALAAAVALALAAAPLRAQDASAPAMLQVFEAKWNTIENRMADVFDVGYGRLWLPPPSRADSGNQSVGYDVFNRFDLGSPRNETLYGTENGLKSLVGVAHRAGLLVNTDFIANHNGFSNLGTVDGKGTTTTADDTTFAESGGYPGFVVTLPGDGDGDFHGAFEAGEEHFRLSGLIDIAQEKNHQFIRQPVEAGNPLNIPAGTESIFGRPPANVPDPANVRFYPDTAGGLAVNDPATGGATTLYNFDPANSASGDAYAENALGLVMRNARWMVQVIGVDGFRYDAARHFPRWVLNYLDQATFRAKPTTLLDGSPQHVYHFSETGYDSPAFLQGFIRKDINNANLGQVGGNRDALDFNLFGALNGNLTSNGIANNWHNVRGASIDLNDDGLRNGSQGVLFAQSHDELGPALQNVAYAYILMMPGNALVYQNAKEFGNGRNFPRGGKDDALGGFYGETITTLVGLRNSHGRGNFRERWIDEAFGDTNGDGQKSNIYIYERSKSAVVGLNNRNDAFVETRNGVQTDFAPGTVLVELTGNATDPTVDAGGVIPEALRVDASGRINVSVPSNQGHGRGYVIYGVPTPQGTLSLTNVASTIAGATPTAANNGTARLAAMDVITGNSFTVQLATTAVTVPAPAGESTPFRDVHADGDLAMFKLDGGLNLNGNAGVDDVAPGSVAYGFENFLTQNSPGYVWSGGANVGTGTGSYAQTIDATQLAEGRHYLTVRAFRHRDGATGGDGGPAVFTDFKRTIYVDRLPPETALVSFDPFASNPGNLSNRDLIVRSVDGTADSMRFFLDVGAAATDAEILDRVAQGQGTAGGYYDRDSFIGGVTNVPTGNHRITIVAYEPSGNYSIRRVPLQFYQGGAAGFGDGNGNGLLQSTDMAGLTSTSFESILYSQNKRFNAAFDVDADGLVTNLDLFSMRPLLTAQGAGAGALAGFDGLLRKRGDLNADGQTNAADLTALYGQIGQPNSWLFDLDVSAAIGLGDVDAWVTKVLGTSRADFNLDGHVDGADFLTWQRNLGATSATLLAGDATLDGAVDGADLEFWKTAVGAAASPLVAAVPEPGGAAILAIATAGGVIACRRSQGNSLCEHGQRRASAGGCG